MAEGWVNWNQSHPGARIFAWQNPWEFDESTATFRLQMEKITDQMVALEEQATLHEVINWLRDHGYRVEKIND